MTQFEVMLHLVGIKTKEGEDFVKVVKDVVHTGSWDLFTIRLENGSLVRVSYLSVCYNGGVSNSSLNERGYILDNPDFTEGPRFWQEFRKAMIKVAQLYEF